MYKRTLYFFITQLIDGNLIIDTYDAHYVYRDDLNYSNISSETLYSVLKNIKDICISENINPIFKLR